MYYNIINDAQITQLVLLSLSLIIHLIDKEKIIFFFFIQVKVCCLFIFIQTIKF